MSVSRICLACTRTERTCVWPDTPSTASHSDKPISKPTPEDDVISLSSGGEDTRPSNKAKAGAHSSRADVGMLDSRGLIHAALSEIDVMLTENREEERARARLLNDLVRARELLAEKRQNVIARKDRDAALDAWFLKKFSFNVVDAKRKAFGFDPKHPPTFPLAQFALRKRDVSGSVETRTLREEVP